MKDEALKLALEALNGVGSFNPEIWGETDRAIIAIKQALAAPVQSCYCPNCEAMGKELAALKAQPAPVQEPVAWKFYLDGCNQVVLDEDSDPVIRHNGTPLYTTPPAQPSVPDAIHHTDLSEHPQYIEGWNDCRAEMLKGMKP